jgi:tetratricopeptide (TPR) repeat protein
LSGKGKINQAKKVINTSLDLHPRNVLLNQYKIDLKNKSFEKNFDCQNLSHIVAEILYITANALSSQDIYSLSNFYLNLSKYLNKNFNSFDTLLAENFYKINNLEKAKKTYNDIGKRGEAFLWYAALQNAKILNKEEKNDKALKTLEEAYEKLSNKKSAYVKFDYAQFLKNNDKYKRSIKLYTEILKEVDKDHSLYAKAAHGRGVAYERTGEWDKAEKDLLSSIKEDSEQAYVINYLAYSWIEQGIKIDKSLEMLKKANDLKSNDPYIVDSLGWALFKLERYNDAKKYLQLAVQLLPSDPVINDHYGDVLWKSGNAIQARYHWRYVLNLEEAEKTLKNKIKNKLILGL